MSLAVSFLGRMPAPTPVIVTEDQKRQLNQISKAATSSQREAFRARIILGLASGKSAEAVAKELNTSMPSVSKWRGRWSREGFAGLRDAAGRGRKASVSPKAVGKALTMAPTRAAHGGAWSVREMAAHTGLSKSTVQRLWAAHGIAPHRIRGFKLSNDLEFEEKYWDVVGLYLHPRKTPWFCAVTRRASARLSSAPRPACPSEKAISAPAPMITTGTGR